MGRYITPACTCDFDNIAITQTYFSCSMKLTEYSNLLMSMMMVSQVFHHHNMKRKRLCMQNKLIRVLLKCYKSNLTMFASSWYNLIESEMNVIN